MNANEPRMGRKVLSGYYKYSDPDRMIRKIWVARAIAQAPSQGEGAVGADRGPRHSAVGTLLVASILIAACQFSGSTPPTISAISITQVATAAAPSEDAAQETEEPILQAALTGPAVSKVAFPERWDYTAVKTADVIPPPDFLDVASIGTVLPWSVGMTENCVGDACTYASVIWPFLPESVIGEVPEATWAVDGREWSLDVNWPSTQSFLGEETVCVIENRWTYEFTVIEAEMIEGRPVASAIVGTWVVAARLDLEASRGDLSFCGASWEYADEWSVGATTGGPWGDVEVAELLAAVTDGNALTGTGKFLTLATCCPDRVEPEFTADVTIRIEPTLATVMMTIVNGGDVSGISYGPIFAVPGEDGEDLFGFITVGVGPDSSQMFAGLITPAGQFIDRDTESPSLTESDFFIDVWGNVYIPPIENISLLDKERSSLAPIPADPITRMMEYSHLLFIGASQGDLTFDGFEFFDDLRDDVLLQPTSDSSGELDTEEIWISYDYHEHFNTYLLDKWFVLDDVVFTEGFEIRGEILVSF